MSKKFIKNMKCWCQGLNWDKIIEEFPDQARIRDWHNCHIDDKPITKQSRGNAE